MKLLISVFNLLLLLTGCNSEMVLTDEKKEKTEVEIAQTNKDIQEFVQDAQGQNGVSLYTDGTDAYYVFLNGINVDRPSEGIYFTDFDVETNGDKLNIHYKQKPVDKESDQSYKQQVLYKILYNSNIEYIKAYKNGKEVPFNIISGNE